MIADFISGKRESAARTRDGNAERRTQNEFRKLALDAGCKAVTLAQTRGNASKRIYPANRRQEERHMTQTPFVPRKKDGLLLAARTIELKTFAGLSLSSAALVTRVHEGFTPVYAVVPTDSYKAIRFKGSGQVGGALRETHEELIAAFNDIYDGIPEAAIVAPAER